MIELSTEFSKYENHKLYFIGIRNFGEKWTENNLKRLVPLMFKPTKSEYPDYDGEYDLLLEKMMDTMLLNIRTEVKGSRASDSRIKGEIYEKPLLSTDNKDFTMNFQQLKPDCTDVFVFTGVWLDTIRYWVMTSDEVKNNRYYCDKQHRGNTGEGQLPFKKSNISLFSEYETTESNLENTIVDAYLRQISNK